MPARGNETEIDEMLNDEVECSGIRFDHIKLSIQLPKHVEEKIVENIAQKI